MSLSSPPLSPRIIYSVLPGLSPHRWPLVSPRPLDLNSKKKEIAKKKKMEERKSKRRKGEKKNKFSNRGVQEKEWMDKKVGMMTERQF